MNAANDEPRALLSWPVALAMSAGAWILLWAGWRIGLAATITLTGAPPGNPPAFIAPVALALCAVVAVGAARVVLFRPLSYEAITDPQDPGPALGATLALAAGLFLAAAIGLVAALGFGLLSLDPSVPPRPKFPYAEPLLYLGLWLLPAGMVKLVDWLALRRDQADA